MSDELVRESLSARTDLTTDSVRERAERQLEEGLERLREAVRRAQDTLRKT
ncbi:hypothetical protein [Streptomyces sp. NPDC002403]